MTIASFALGHERLNSPMVEEVRERLGEAGIASYQIEVAGAGEPELELDGATYIGQREIEHGVQMYIDELRSTRA